MDLIGIIGSSLFHVDSCLHSDMLMDRIFGYMEVGRTEYKIMAGGLGDAANYLNEPLLYKQNMILHMGNDDKKHCSWYKEYHCQDKGKSWKQYDESLYF